MKKVTSLSINITKLFALLTQFYSILVEVRPRNNCMKYLEHLKRLFGAKEDLLKGATQVCTMQLPGRN
jgi:hypothetical protein